MTKQTTATPRVTPIIVIQVETEIKKRLDRRYRLAMNLSYCIYADCYSFLRAYLYGNPDSFHFRQGYDNLAIKCNQYLSYQSGPLSTCFENHSLSRTTPPQKMTRFACSRLLKNAVFVFARSPQATVAISKQLTYNYWRLPRCARNNRIITFSKTY